MVMGCGARCNYRVLQKALAKLAAEAPEGERMFEKANTHILNPKGITQAQLYGSFDPVRGESAESAHGYYSSRYWWSR